MYSKIIIIIKINNQLSSLSQSFSVLVKQHRWRNFWEGTSTEEAKEMEDKSGGSLDHLRVLCQYLFF